MVGRIELNGKRVLVIGLARTGVAAALFCAAHGAIVTATDTRSAEELQEVTGTLRQAGVRLHWGNCTPDILQGLELIIPSPGVPADAPLIQEARALGLTIWSEVELADHFLCGKLIAITGSNGKTTTTALVEHILRAAEFSTVLAGNIGTPLIAHVGETTDQTITVAELRSFQLELIEDFQPNIAVFLNLTPDHLDRHKTMAAYGAAKARIFENQTADDIAALNADDSASASYAPTRPAVFWFSRKTEVRQGAFVRNGGIVFRRDGKYD